MYAVCIQKCITFVLVHSFACGVCIQLFCVLQPYIKDICPRHVLSYEVAAFGRDFLPVAMCKVLYSIIFS